MDMKRTIRIGQRLIGAGEPCYLIAEVGVNHNGSLELALQLVERAVTAGACAVKFQTFHAETLVTRDAPKAAYQKSPGEDETHFDMLKRLELSADSHIKLMERCTQLGADFLSSPFDEKCADFLHSLGVAAFKIPSGEVTNLPFLRHVAAMGRPVVLSTGMSTLAEVTDAVDTLKQTGCQDLVLLHCVSSYPAAPEDANLRAMATLERTFGTPVGYSDHVIGNEVSLAAVALGAAVIEKHFTLDRSLPGPDHKASAEPSEFECLARSIRCVESALGTGVKMPAAAERDIAHVARKSLVAAGTIPAGAILTDRMVERRRPGTGLPPASLNRILGKRALVDIPAGTLLKEEHFQCEK